ncbi:MAG: DUF4215 domain-containing protein [Polyangiaceae bacterium]|jgi:cysteine-rich repeat protein|nr:DUF4215 domain-containing protein [Polyangiaceae bacterium]
MMRLSWLLLASLLLVSACSDPPAAEDDGFGQICTPGNYVFCKCDELSHGTKRCSNTGKSFGACINCQSGEIPPEGCTPGADYPCLCDDGAEGIYTCLEDGASFDVCRDCGSAGSSSSGDACPGIELLVPEGEVATLSGDTTGAIDQFGPKCTDKLGPDLVYRLMPAASGFLTVRVEGVDAADPVLISWGNDCGGFQEACADSGGSGSAEELTLPAIAGQPVYVAVDTAEGEGAFSLSATLDASAPKGDVCPGVPVAISPGFPQLFLSSTVGASADTIGALDCSSATGGDVVYTVQPTAAGLLTIEVQPKDGFDATLYVREKSCDAGPQIACNNTLGPDGQERASFLVAPGEIYSVFVDGTAEGVFELVMQLDQNFCGDGKVQAPEQCDDGNQLSLDGCSSQCKVEQDPPATACPGLPVHVFDQPLLLSGSTEPYEDNQSQSSCGGSKAPDRVYRVVPGKSGTLRARVTSTSFDLILYARRDACSGAGAKFLGCDDKFTGTSEILLDLPVTEGAPVWLVIDGFQASEAGIFALELSLL